MSNHKHIILHTLFIVYLCPILGSCQNGAWLATEEQRRFEIREGRQQILKDWDTEKGIRGERNGQPSHKKFTSSIHEKMRSPVWPEYGNPSSSHHTIDQVNTRNNVSEGEQRARELTKEYQLQLEIIEHEYAKKIESTYDIQLRIHLQQECSYIKEMLYKDYRKKADKEVSIYCLGHKVDEEGYIYFHRDEDSNKYDQDIETYKQQQALPDQWSDSAWYMYPKASPAHSSDSKKVLYICYVNSSSAKDIPVVRDTRNSEQEALEKLENNYQWELKCITKTLDILDKQKAKASLYYELFESSKKLWNHYIWESAHDALRSHLEQLPPLPENRPVIEADDELWMESDSLA